MNNPWADLAAAMHAVFNQLLDTLEQGLVALWPRWAAAQAAERKEHVMKKDHIKDQDHTRCHCCEEHGVCDNHNDNSATTPFAAGQTASAAEKSKSQPFGFCGAGVWPGSPGFAANTAAFTARTYYRYELDTGKVVAVTEFPLGVPLFAFGALPGHSTTRYESEAAARTAARAYCDTRVAKLQKMALEHTAWLHAHENRPPQFALDEEVRYTGAQQGMKGKTGKVVAIQKQGPAKFAYLVNWPSYAYYNARDWVIESSLERVVKNPPPKGFLLDEK